jgi:hypothetical protein
VSLPFNATPAYRHYSRVRPAGPVRPPAPKGKLARGGRRTPATTPPMTPHPDLQRIVLAAKRGGDLGPGSAAAPTAVGNVHGHPGHAAALAPHPDRKEVDLSSATAGPSAGPGGNPGTVDDTSQRPASCECLAVPIRPRFTHPKQRELVHSARVREGPPIPTSRPMMFRLTQTTSESADTARPVKQAADLRTRQCISGVPRTHTSP